MENRVSIPLRFKNDLLARFDINNSESLTEEIAEEYNIEDYDRCKEYSIIQRPCPLCIEYRNLGLEGPPRCYMPKAGGTVLCPFYGFRFGEYPGCVRWLNGLCKEDVQSKITISSFYITWESKHSKEVEGHFKKVKTEALKLIKWHEEENK